MDIYQYTDPGGRDCNEDSCAVAQSGNVTCAVMADGLGGHGGGDVASQEAVSTVTDLFSRRVQYINDLDKGIYEDWFTTANASVCGLQTENCLMKTTLCVLCISREGTMAKWAHVGDSRIYHFIDGRMHSVTFDHSVSRMAVLAGEISMDEIRFHADRNKLLKAIGMQPVPAPEYGECELDMAHKHAFLLCTDGFWEYVTEDLMEEILAGKQCAKAWITAMAEIIAQNAKPGHDNNSAIGIVL